MVRGETAKKIRNCCWQKIICCWLFIGKSDDEKWEGNKGYLYKKEEHSHHHAIMTSPGYWTVMITPLVDMEGSTNFSTATVTPHSHIRVWQQLSRQQKATEGWSHDVMMNMNELIIDYSPFLECLTPQGLSTELYKWIYRMHQGFIRYSRVAIPLV